MTCQKPARIAESHLIIFALKRPDSGGQLLTKVVRHVRGGGMHRGSPVVAIRKDVGAIIRARKSPDADFRPVY